MTHNAQSIEGYHSGDTLIIKVSVVDSDENAVDIRDADITYAIADSQSGTATQQVTKTVSGGGITITDGKNGKFEIDIAPADTADLTGSFPHECQVKDTNGDIATIFGGSINITEDIITTS